MARYISNYRLLILVIFAFCFVITSCKKRETESSLKSGLSEYDSTISISSSVELEELDELSAFEEDEDFEVMSIEIDLSNFIAPTSEQIQNALKNAGYYKGEIDGKIGPKSKKAILDFQIDNDLEPDGVVGSRTWSRLKDYLDS